MRSSTLLPVTRAADLAEVPAERRWLVEQLWGDEAVGIVGGEPKCCKSFLALDLAVAVASGSPCVRRFPVARTGRVLLFAAEDALHVVRRRLAGISRASGHDLADLDIHVITAPAMRLDVERDRDALLATVDKLRPRLLVLDPFVRLHRVDENLSGEVAPLLAYLRELQRRYHVAGRADELASSPAHSTTDSGCCSHRASPSCWAAAAWGWRGGGSLARNRSSFAVKRSRVVVDDGLITRRGCIIREASGVALVWGGHRHRRHLALPHRACGVNFLLSPIAHDLCATPPPGFGRRVHPRPLERPSVRPVGLLASRPTRDGAAGIGAVDLAGVAEPAHVKHRFAALTADLANAVGIDGDQTHPDRGAT